MDNSSIYNQPKNNNTSLIIIVVLIITVAPLVTFGVIFYNISRLATTVIGEVATQIPEAISGLTDGSVNTERQSLALQKVYLAYHSTELLERGITKSECADIATVFKDDVFDLCAGDEVSFSVSTDVLNVISMSFIGENKFYVATFSNGLLSTSTIAVTDNLSEVDSDNSYKKLKITSEKTSFDQLEQYNAK